MKLEFSLLVILHKKNPLQWVGGSNLSKSNKKELSMDKITRKTPFEQWLSPISNELFEELVNTHRLDYYK